MCGIMGYIGRREASDIIVRGLLRQETRGYDGAGAATLSNGQLHHVRALGPVANLDQRVREVSLPGHLGIGHTRWATHGCPAITNTHPHIGGDKVLALVHNGTLEKYDDLQEQLRQEGYTFTSSTDSEVAAHFLAQRITQAKLAINAASHAAADYLPLGILIQDALAELHGTYGLAIVITQFPNVLIAARRRSPVLIGTGDGEYFIASSAAGLQPFTTEGADLDDHEIAIVTREGIQLLNKQRQLVSAKVFTLASQAGDANLNGYPHYMLKEIMEQPAALARTMAGRLNFEDGTANIEELRHFSPRRMRSIERIMFIACGTSWHAGLVGKYLFEELTRIPVEVEYASELRYRNPPLTDRTLLIAISQSGETADTLAALREVRRRGHPALAICNVPGSSIAKEADDCIFLNAGPEIGVASTKAFTCQCTMLAMLALYLGRMRHLSYADGLRLLSQLEQLPEKVTETLACDALIQEIAGAHGAMRNCLYLGRQFNWPVALEGALKLKEISYIHAEGMPAAEMKHGPIALIDEDTPSIVLITRDELYEKILANVQEIRARGGPVIAIAHRGDRDMQKHVQHLVPVPATVECLQPIINIVPLQQLAYNLAVRRGCDVDRPRNLAKSVTVE